MDDNVPDLLHFCYAPYLIIDSEMEETISHPVESIIMAIFVFEDRTLIFPMLIRFHCDSFPHLFQHDQVCLIKQKKRYDFTRVLSRWSFEGTVLAFAKEGGPL